MTLSRADLNTLIEDIIKVHPDATDTDKLQGKRHRVLLKTILDYVDSAGGAVGGGDFPFDWTVPSNAFGGYFNAETTFSKGMWKFLHRDQPPTAAMSATNPRRPKGSSGATTLSWSINPGNAPLTTLRVAGINITPVTRQGTLDVSSGVNQDTTFPLYVQDALGQVATASAAVVFRSPGFLFTSNQDLFNATDATISQLLSGIAPNGLLDNRNMSAQLNPNLEKLYVAFPAAMDPGSGDATIVVNTLVDNSFRKRAFQFTNTNTFQGDPAGFTEGFVLYCGSNTLMGAYNVGVS
jgi:hypothetical protein